MTSAAAIVDAVPYAQNPSFRNIEPQGRRGRASLAWIGPSVDPIRVASAIRDQYTRPFRHFADWAVQNKKSMNADDIGAYFRNLNDSGLSASTVRVRRAAVKARARAIYANALDIEGTARLEAALAALDRSVKAPRKATEAVRAPILDKADYRAIIAACRSEKQRLFCRFLWATGCRVSELAGARLDKCKPEGAAVAVTIIGKGKKERTVQIPTDLYDAIRAEFAAAAVYLFETSGGKPYSRSYIAREIAKIGDAAGLRAWPHLFRHSFASRQYERRPEKLEALSRYMGHSSPSITIGMYVHSNLTVDELFSDLE